MKLLELPDSVVAPNQIEKIFWGIPFFGVDKRAFTMLRRVQKERTIKIDSLWEIGGKLHLSKSDMDDILQKYFKWPYRWFHPQDRCSALFFYPFGDLSDAEGYGAIEKRFGNFVEIGETFREKSYFELLDFLTQ